MRTERLTESSPTVLALTAAEANQLRVLGRTMASNRRWWGELDEPEDRPRRVIRCEQESTGRYRVVVANAVGAIGLGEVQLIVQPKIPVAHLLYLLGESQQLPRVAGQRSAIDDDAGFFVLVARWFLDSCEILLRHDLIRDYERVTADLPFARGRIHAAETARSVLAGRPMVRCDFDRYGEDTALNRVLRAAAQTLLATPVLPDDLRRRARRVHMRLDGARPVQHRDIFARPDARSRHYRDAHPLALSILSGSGVAPREGQRSAWTFLFRTPEAVEEGIREALHRHLDPRWQVRKKGRALAGTRNRTLNPDLVFGDGLAVGDVKYRLSNGDIGRSHLNQVTTFATGYGAERATVIAFGSVPVGEQVDVGEVRVNGFNWNITEFEPAAAARALALDVEAWLAG